MQSSSRRVAEKHVGHHGAEAACGHAVDRAEQERAEQHHSVAKVYIAVRGGHGNVYEHRCDAGKRGEERRKDKLDEFFVFHAAPPFVFCSVAPRLDIFKYQFGAKI